MAVTKDGTYLGESTYGIKTFFTELAQRSNIPADQINVTLMNDWIGAEGIVLNGGESAATVLGSLCDHISSIAIYTEYNAVRIVHLPSEDDYTGVYTLDPNKYAVSPITYNKASTQPQQFKLSYIEKYSNSLNESYEYIDNSAFTSQASEVSLSAGLVLTQAQAQKVIKTAKMMYGFETANISFSIPYQDGTLRMASILQYKGKLYRINSKIHDHHLVTYTALSDSQLFYRDKSSVLPDPTPQPPAPTESSDLAWVFISTAPLLNKSPMITQENTDYFTAITMSRDSENVTNSINSTTLNTNQNGILCRVMDWVLPEINPSDYPKKATGGYIQLAEKPIASGRDENTDYTSHSDFSSGFLFLGDAVVICEDIQYGANYSITINNPIINWGNKQTNFEIDQECILTTGRAVTLWEVTESSQLVTQVVNASYSNTTALNPTEGTNKAGRGITPIKIIKCIHYDSTTNQHWVYFQYSKQTGDVRYMHLYPEDEEITVTVNGVTQELNPYRKIFCEAGDLITVTVTADNQTLTSDTLQL